MGVKENLRPLTDAQRKLAEENIGLAACAASLFWRRNRETTPLSWDQVVSAAELGLVVAARGFNPERVFTHNGVDHKANFSTFAMVVMADFIRREQSRRGYVITLPYTAFEMRLDDQDSETRERLMRVADARSIDFRGRNKDDSPVLKLSDPRGSEGIHRHDLADEVRHLMRVLPARYRSVIHARYWDGLNMEEIGQRFGFTKARADQIVKLGLKRLRTALEEQEEPCSTR